jgi:dipeptidyl aminopeptidase/acylaminoacyl peptidase
MSKPNGKRPITRDDLLKIQFVGDPQMSPDGRRLVCTVKTIDAEKNRYFSHLWLFDLETKRARQFTFGEVSDTSPRWSPDGSTIAFLRAFPTQRGKPMQMWVIPTDGGEARQLTTLPEGAISSITWAPKGEKLAFCFRPAHPEFTQEARKKREETGKSTPPRVITRLHYKLDGFGFLDERQHVWVCDAETGEAQQITHGDWDDFDPAWSPDGSRIAFVSNRSEDPEETPYLVDLWWVPAEGGEPQKIETPPGYKGALAWSPDGSLIAYVGHISEEDPWVPRHDRLWVVSPQGGDARCLTESLDRTVGNVTLSDTREAFAGGSPPIWSPDGRALYFPVSDRGSCHLYRVGVEGGEPHALTEGALDLAAVTADSQCERFALLIATPTQPAEVYLGKPSSNALELEKLSDFNSSWLEEIQLSEPEELWLERPDGAKVQGWLLHPPDFAPDKKYPLLLYIHGGPHAQYGHTFFHEFQWHAARGYVVLYTNPRGSSGYAEEFMTAIRGNWGKEDFEDLMAFVDYVLQERSYLDPERLAVAGGSYGGYMTNWILGHTQRFRCAVTDRSVVNLISMFGTCDFPFRPDGYWPGDPWSRPETLLTQSPLSHLQGAKTPTLIIHSEGDLRCPIEQAEQLFMALKRLKVEVVFVRYPQETSHGLSRGGPPDLRLDRLQRIGEWLDRHIFQSTDAQTD